jgi:hypothetical protein
MKSPDEGAKDRVTDMEPGDSHDDGEHTEAHNKDCIGGITALRHSFAFCRELSS